MVVLKDLGSFAEIAAALRGLEDSGGFGGINSSDTVLSQSKQETYFHQDVAKALGKLRERMTNIDDTSVIIYPGSSSDETLARVFGPGVIHVDPDEYAMEAMREKGYNVAEMTIEEYVSNMPEEGRVDVVFSYNSGLVPHLGKNPRVTLVCAIDPESKSGEIINEEEAQAALGIITTESGNMNIDIEKNPNTLWLFRKNGEPSAKLQ